MLRPATAAVALGANLLNFETVVLKHPNIQRTSAAVADEGCLVVEVEEVVCVETA